MTQNFVNPNNTQQRPDGKYNSVIADIQKAGVCPFCPEQLKNYHKNPILEESAEWVLTENMYPYKGAKHHLLLIHKKHISTIDEMSATAWSELQELIKKATTRFNITGGTFFARFGDTRFTGASVTHLHAHIVVSNPEDPQYSPLLTRIG